MLSDHWAPGWELAIGSGTGRGVGGRPFRRGGAGRMAASGRRPCRRGRSGPWVKEAVFGSPPRRHRDPCRRPQRAAEAGAPTSAGLLRRRCSWNVAPCGAWSTGPFPCPGPPPAMLAPEARTRLSGQCCWLKALGRTVAFDTHCRPRRFRDDGGRDHHRARAGSRDGFGRPSTRDGAQNPSCRRIWANRRFIRTRRSLCAFPSRRATRVESMSATTSAAIRLVVGVNTSVLSSVSTLMTTSA